MGMFNKNKNNRSRDQHKIKFHFVTPALKTNVNKIFFHGEVKFHFEFHVNTLWVFLCGFLA